jgi:hypothetical protein
MLFVHPLTLSGDVVTGNSLGSGAHGAGGINNSGTLTIAGSTISGNTGNYAGGINNGGPLSITDSTISDNAGGLSTFGVGGIDSYASGTSLTGCAVSGNTGGGIAVTTNFGSPASTLTVTDSQIVNNTIDRSPITFSDALGAGIYALEATVNVTGSLIADNTASARLAMGAGIFMGETPTFVTSVGTTLTVTDSTFQGNQVIGTGIFGRGDGGAIHTDPSANISVSDSSFLGNTVTSTSQPEGGAMDLNGLVSGTISGSVFSGNQAAATGGSAPSDTNAYGGAIANSGGVTAASGKNLLTITGSTFVNNQVLGGPGSGGGFAQGGAIVNQGGATLSLSSSLLMNNSAIGGPNPTSFSTVSWGLGGGLCNQFSAKATVSDTVFIGNQAVGGASQNGGPGGLGAGGAILNSSGSKLTLTGGIIAGNSAVGGAASTGAAAGNGQGGGIDDLRATLQVSGAAIIGNSAVGGSGGGSGDGGGVFVSGKTAGAGASLTDVLITLNAATSGSGGGSGYGGGLYIATGAITTLKNTQVVGNNASTAGDDIYGSYTSG